MPPTSPRAPSALQKKGSQRPVKPKGAVTTALRRYNMLSQPVTNQLTIDDLMVRIAMMSEEAGERSELHKTVHDALIFDKINAAVARHWYSTMSSRQYLQEDEASVFANLMTTHYAMMKVLRSRVPLQRVQKLLTQCVQEEDLTRRKNMFLEEKMFKDFFELLLVETRADAERRRREAERLRILREGVNISGEADEQAVSLELHHVRLPSGCPFIHSKNCPFHGAAWVDRESYCEQHDKNKYPRLKNPLALEQKSYDALLQQKAASATQMDFRMFSHSRPTSAKTK